MSADKERKTKDEIADIASLRQDAGRPEVPESSSGVTARQEEACLSREPVPSSEAGETAEEGPGSRRERRAVLQRLLDGADRIDWRYKLQLTAGFSLAIIAAAYLLRERLLALDSWGYLGAFIINGVSNASIIFPAPGGVAIAIMAQEFNPLLIGIAAGIGGALGGFTAYVAGAVATSSARRRTWYRWTSRLMGRFGGVVIFTFALIPVLPGDLASLAAGAVRYSARRYLLYNGVASVIKMTVVAYLGADFLSWLERTTVQWVSTWT